MIAEAQRPLQLKPLVLVVAATANTRAIGKSGGLPWRLMKDMRFFQALTQHLPSW
jgi:dihydrofolate reductase